jgi:branched-chain amino acid transport system ATP-binding protein
LVEFLIDSGVAYLEEVDKKTLLQIKEVTKWFGGVAALQGLNLRVAQDEIIGLIGPNGAGKTTLFNLISGNIRQDLGEIYFGTRNIDKLKPFERCRLGIARTYQTVRPFLDFSVEQNLMIGACYGRAEDRTCGRGLHQDIEAILESLGLQTKRRELAKNLTLVDRKLVEVARALATKPKLLLLDEVLSGLNPSELERAVQLIKELSLSFGLTIIWIEHIMQALLAICDRFVVLDYGIILTEGRPTEVVSDERVIEAYLGRAGKKFVENMGKTNPDTTE